jgi:hypothetical protein
MAQYFQKISKEWEIHLQNKVFRIYLGSTLFLFTMVVHFCTKWISILECRNGICFSDSLVQLFTPKDFSIPIFCITHSAMFLSIFFNLSSPFLLLKAFQAYSLVLMLRTFFIYVIPLEPPFGMLYLNDPLVGFFLNNSNIVTKDLFFSGHISAMFVFIYFTQNKLLKSYLIYITPILAILLLWQHVHYTIDIVAAPFFAIFCCKITEKINQLLGTT